MSRKTMAPMFFIGTGIWLTTALDLRAWSYLIPAALWLFVAVRWSS